MIGVEVMTVFVESFVLSHMAQEPQNDNCSMEIDSAMDDDDNVKNAEAIMDDPNIGNRKSKINPISTPLCKQTSSLIQRPRSSLKRPRNTIKRLSLNSLSTIQQQPLSNTNNSSPSSQQSNDSQSSIKSRIKRPKLSISRPSRTGNIYSLFITLIIYILIL